MTLDFYMINLIEIIIAILVGIISAVFTRFFSFLIGNPVNGDVSNNIFSFYGRYILRKFNDIEINRPNDYTGLNFWKAAGVCPYCVNVYITGAIFVASHYMLGVDWWWAPLVIAISHIALCKIYESEE